MRSPQLLRVILYDPVFAEFKHPKLAIKKKSNMYFILYLIRICLFFIVVNIVWLQ